jgi:acyl-CoA synthetase (AMP-forming)/AMP-acid ligase II
MELKNILLNGIELKSSGTTGPAKTIFQSPEKLKAANNVAIDSQELTKNSRVYTVCKMQHAGGLLAQTLPAYSIGADIVIEDFSAYRWVKEIYKYTHTHLTPKHCRAIMGTKDFWNCDLNGLWITCGSDPVEWDIITAFVNAGATFMTNWGMTEVGPCAVNTVFPNIESVESYKEYQLDGMTLMGDRTYVDWKIENGEFFVKGDICVYDDWFATGDLVNTNYPGDLYYDGRK